MENFLGGVEIWIGILVGFITNPVNTLFLVILIGVFSTELRKLKRRKSKPDTKRSKGYWK